MISVLGGAPLVFPPPMGRGLRTPHQLGARLRAVGHGLGAVQVQACRVLWCGHLSGLAGIARETPRKHFELSEAAKFACRIPTAVRSSHGFSCLRKPCPGRGGVLNQRHAWIFSLALMGVGTYTANARATVSQLSAECAFQGGLDCQASCGKVTFEASCDAELAASCRGQCNASADVSCAGTCQGSCQADCTAHPGTLTCQGRCSTQCGADCDAHCTGSAAATSTAASAQADCKAKCRASCNASCDASCSGTPPSADCAALCQGSCSGQCSAKANIDCQVSCQATGHASCVAKANADCSANCTAHGGVLVCNGEVQAFLDTVESAVAWLEQHVVVNATSSSSCSGNTCQAQASASVSSKCSAAPVPATSMGGLASAAGAELGLVGLACLAGGARKRRGRTQRPASKAKAE